MDVDAAPARELEELLAFLRREHCDRFLYRGQTKVYPRPLLPTGYRPYRRTGKVYDRTSPLFAHALRRNGNEFIDLVPINHFFETLPLFYPENSEVPAEELELLLKLSNDQYLARTLADGPEAIETLLTPLEALVFRERFPLWKKVIDYDHRLQIRDMVFMRPFGYLLGQALAQQYGFSSEMLDATADVDVAAFFATRASPAFTDGPSEGVGVIYRFIRTEEAAPLDLGAYNFYSCPPLLSIERLLERFCVDDPSIGSRPEIESFLVESFEKHGKWRRWEQFRIHRDILDETRIARQHAAFIVPDAIYVEQGKIPNNTRLLMAMEDCATRTGTEAFYFRHTPHTRHLTNLTREYLWPNDNDALFEMIGNALLASVRLDTGQILPSRIDLLDPGYGGG